MRKLTTAELVATKPSPEEFERWPRFPVSVLCDNIRSLDNVGIIFRISDAARIAKLYLCGITGYPPLPEGDTRLPYVSERAGRVIAKTAIETTKYVPWQHREEAGDVLREQKTLGSQIVVLEQTATSVDYTVAQYQFPLCLVLGHEREGVADDVLALADLVIQIPMHGMGNSLNVATAYGIVVYELLRRCVHPLNEKAREEARSRT